MAGDRNETLTKEMGISVYNVLLNCRDLISSCIFIFMGMSLGRIFFLGETNC